MKTLLRHKKLLLFAFCIFVTLLKIGKMVMLTDHPAVIEPMSELFIVKNSLNATEVPVSKQDEILSAGLPNLPYLAWKANKDKRWNLKCGQYPSIFDVPFYNTYWQTVKLSNYTLQMYGAYYDDRPIFQGKAYVRLYVFIDTYMPNLNGMQDNQTKPIPAYCQLWFDSQVEPVVVNVTHIRYAWRTYWGYDKNGGYEGHFLTCEIPTSHRNSTPSSVTLVEQECGNGTNHMKVMNERPANNGTKTDFAVCVHSTAFPYEDLSLRYIEWIELQLAMGASQIYFYIMDMHPNNEKIFKYYEEQGKVRVSYTNFPSGTPNVHGLPLLYLKQQVRAGKWESISMNDCYFRNMYKHKFIAMLDADELLMPKMQYKNWYELFDGIEHEFNITRGTYNSFNFQHSYFLHNPQQEKVQDIPHYLYMFQHVERVAEYSKVGEYVKSFHNTENCLAMHNHFPMYCVQKDDWCNNFMFNNSYAQLNHYRNDCHRWNNTCDLDIDKRVKDENILKFKKAVPKILKTIQDLDKY